MLMKQLHIYSTESHDTHVAITEHVKWLILSQNLVAMKVVHLCTYVNINTKYVPQSYYKGFVMCILLVVTVL